MNTSYCESFVYICTPRDDVRRIQQRYFINLSIFTISKLLKRRVHPSLRAYHYRMGHKNWCICITSVMEVMVLEVFISLSVFPEFVITQKYSKDLGHKKISNYKQSHFHSMFNPSALCSI